MTAAYLVTTALMVLAVAAIRHHRPAVSVPVVILVLAVAGWNLTRAIRGPDDPEPSIVIAVNVLLVQICAASFYLTARRLVHGRWRVSAWLYIVAVNFGTLSFLGMLPELGITDGDHYYESPVYVVHLAYTLALLGAGVLTLSTRQYDSSPHVRRVVGTVQVFAVIILTCQVLMPAFTSLAVGVVSLALVWTTGHVGAWSRSASRADRLLDSIGVFIFVVDPAGRLQDWNGPAASLLRLMGQTASHGLDLAEALGHPPSFGDGATVSLTIQGGELRTALSVHPVDPLVRASDSVLMFRPVRSSLESSSFPLISGALAGHDPTTQTLGRKAALEQLKAAVNDGTPMVRIEVTPRTRRRADEVMFLMARRMEARSAEHGFPHAAWARLDTWTYVTPLLDHDFEGVPALIPVDDMGVDMTVSFHSPLPNDAPADFIRRIDQSQADRHTAHGT